MRCCCVRVRSRRPRRARPGERSACARSGARAFVQARRPRTTPPGPSPRRRSGGTSLRPRDLAAAAQASPDLARHLDRREAPGPGCEQGTGLPSNLAREPARSRPSRASHPLGCRLHIAARSDRLSARGRPVLVRVCAVHDAKRAKCNETLRPGGGDATQLSSSAP